MAFDPTTGEQITLQLAATLTENYRNSRAFNGFKAHAVGKDHLMEILSQTDCMGIRTYYAIDEFDEPTFVMVGVDADGNDITEGYIAERFQKCPPECSSKNPLNGL